ncbi:MAG TPA: PRC-barrel domain-containing protein [Thermomicrobiales bacterium]|nr:PRC-barrel domain-containing protein [Thermomicrobiales bacterium]
MNIELGSDIYGNDGEKLGVVDSLVVEPDNGAISSVIVRKGLFFPTDKILPASAVTSVDEQGVHVNVSKADVEQLTEYMDAEYVWPPAGYYGSYGSHGYMWPATSVYATGLMVDDEIEERHPGSIILSEGTLVVDNDNDDVGRITEMATDDRGRVVGFRVEEGFFRHHEHYIPANLVDTADDVVVRLKVPKERLESITGPEEARRYE